MCQRWITPSIPMPRAAIWASTAIGPTVKSPKPFATSSPGGFQLEKSQTNEPRPTTIEPEEAASTNEAILGKSDWSDRFARHSFVEIPT